MKLDTDLRKLFHDAAANLFPGARPLDVSDKHLNFDTGFFLKEGENVIWAEIVPGHFSSREITGYLSKARSLETIFPGGIKAVLLAADFEKGVQELLALLRFPVRFLRYELGATLTDVTPPARLEAALPPGARNRLSREELREFIQLEIDLGSN